MSDNSEKQTGEESVPEPSLDLLSQEELDALLLRISIGEVEDEEYHPIYDARKLRIYDLVKADVFTADQTDALQFLHERSVGAMGEFLSARTGLDCRLYVESADALTVEEFLVSTRWFPPIGEIEFRRLGGNGLLHFGPQVTFALLDGLLGGAGKSPHDTHPFRNTLTYLETAVLEDCVRGLLPGLRDGWGFFLDIDPHLVGVRPAEEVTPIGKPNDSVLHISLSVQLNKVEGRVDLCIPRELIRPLFPLMEKDEFVKRCNAAQLTPPDSAETSRPTTSSLRMHAEFPAAYGPMTRDELAKLSPGDVLPLDPDARARELFEAAPEQDRE